MVSEARERAGPPPLLRFAAVAGACAVLGLVVAGALRQVDPAFALSYWAVDFRRPSVFFAPAEPVGASELGRASWAGSAPLQVRLGPIRAGDVIKVKVRAETGTCRVALRVGEAVIASWAVGERWEQAEVVSPVSGSPLVFVPLDLTPCSLHLSRVSVANVVGHSRGTFPVYLRAAYAAAGGRGRAGPPWVLGAAVLVVGVLAGWRRRTGARSWGAALLGAAGDLLPAAAVIAAGELLRFSGRAFVVMPPRTFLALLLLSAVVVEAVRCRRKRVAPSRWGVRGRRGAALAVSAVRAGLGAIYGRLLAPLGSGATAAGWRLERLAAATRLDTVTAQAAASGRVAGVRLVRATAGFGVLLALAAALFARGVVRDFAVPLVGPGDLSLWERQNAYVARNLSLTPFPRLDLHNDQLFYPYGGNNVFQPWVFELHLFAGAARCLLGVWGWCQLYFLLSVTVAALGSFLLLVRDHGAWRAAAAALTVSFANYYAIAKYGGHLSVACVHWTTLSLLTDFVIVHRLVERRPWSARLLLLRAFLLCAALGLELGYVAGIGLTSALVTAVVAAAVVCHRAGWRGGGLRAAVAAMARDLATSSRAHPVQVVLLAAAAAVAAWLFVPLVLQVWWAAREFSFAGMTASFWWASPLRLLHPILPGASPLGHRSLFHDQPEGVFAASPGLGLVLLALAGVVAGRRRLVAGLPALTLLLLFLSYHPERVPHLEVLPWFSFARISDRFTVAYPALLAALALLAPPRLRWRGRAVAAGLVALVAAETVTAYRLDLSRPRRFPRLDASFTALMDAVRQAPGEAVLDWPFCVAGGNGVGTGALCRFYHRQSGLALLQAFHEKKIVGAYFGRLHPRQIQPYLDAGWPRLFFPDRRSPMEATRQRRDFEPDEWEFLERFLRLGDFCGVLLHLDLLPEETVAAFHARFGAPAAAAATPFGRLEFIPKPAAWRRDTDVEAARRLVAPVVSPVLPVGRAIPMAAPATDEFLGPGWGAVWKGRRTSEARAVELRFRTEAEGPCRLRLLAGTFLTQRVLVAVDGAPAGEFRHDGGALRVFEIPMPVETRRRDTVVRFDLPDARSPASAGLGDDRRLLGLTVEWFRLDCAEPVTSRQMGRVP